MERTVLIPVNMKRDFLSISIPEKKTVHGKEKMVKRAKIPPAKPSIKKMQHISGLGKKCLPVKMFADFGHWKAAITKENWLYNLRTSAMLWLVLRLASSRRNVEIVINFFKTNN